MPAVPSEISLDGQTFRVAEVPNAFIALNDPLQPPRSEIAGDPGAVNLQKAEWQWTLTRFEGGEGRIVFDAQDTDPPHFYQTDGAVDTRTSGEFTMGTLPALVVNADGGTTTTTQGSALTGHAGTSGVDYVLDTLGNPAHTEARLINHVAAGEVKVATHDPTDGPVYVNFALDIATAYTTRFEGNTLTDVTGTSSDTGTDTIIGPGEEVKQGSRVHAGGVSVNVTIRWKSQGPGSLAIFRVHNETGSTDVDTTGSVSVGSTFDTITLSFTAEAGKTYGYYAKDGATSSDLQIDYIEESVTDTSCAYTLTIRNTTDSTDVTPTSGSLTGTATGPTIASLLYTAAAGKSYEYRVKNNGGTGADAETLIVDYISEVLGTLVTDPRLLVHGYNDDIWAVHHDGTNSDLFRYDFTNNEWDDIDDNFVAQLPVAAASSDRYLYILMANSVVWRFTATADSGVAYTTAPAGTGVGIAVANNRLYVLTTTTLTEYTLDGAAPTYAGTTKVAAGSFYNAETADQTVRQQMCGTENGVRFFTNVRGGPTTIYDFSDGALKPIGVLKRGWKATAIEHYDGITYIGAQTSNRALSPALTRSAIYYIDQPSMPPKHLGWLRFQDPDDEPIRSITAWGTDVYFLQGLNVWRYSTLTGGLVLDRVVGATTEENAVQVAVMDRKLWVAYSGQGIFVTANAYPSQTMYLYSPLWDFDAPADDKTVLGFEVLTKPLPANTAISMQYRLDEATAWTTLGTSQDVGTTLHTFAVSSAQATYSGRILQWRVGLSSSDGVSTPTVRAVTSRVLVLDYQQAFEMALDIRDDASSDRAVGGQLTGRGKMALLTTIRDNKALVAMVDRYSTHRSGDSDSYTGILRSIQPELDERGQGIARVRFEVVV